MCKVCTCVHVCALCEHWGESCVWNSCHTCGMAVVKCYTKHTSVVSIFTTAVLPI